MLHLAPLRPQKTRPASYVTMLQTGVRIVDFVVTFPKWELGLVAIAVSVVVRPRA